MKGYEIIQKIAYGTQSVAYIYYFVTKDYMCSVFPPLSMLDS